MKKIITLIAVLFIAINSFAHRGGILKIRDAEGRKIAININGRNFPQQARVLTVKDLPSGVNRIKVYRVRNGRGVYNRADLIYSGVIRIKSGYIYRCTVDDYEGLDVQSYCCTNDDGNYYNADPAIGQGDYYNQDDNNWNDNYWHGYNDNQQGNNNNNGWNNNNNNWSNDNDGHDQDGHNHDGYNYNNGYNNNRVMNQQQFQAFKQTVSNNNFDSGKLTLVKTQLQSTWINCAQLTELVSLFSFESSKLDVAKVGATKVVDKQNLFTIYNSFSFESTKTEFAAFIATLQ
jgi:hypothetical protein